MYDTHNVAQERQIVFPQLNHVQQWLLDIDKCFHSYESKMKHFFTSKPYSYNNEHDFTSVYIYLIVELTTRTGKIGKDGNESGQQNHVRFKQPYYISMASNYYPDI